MLWGGCLSFVNVVCHHVEVSALGQSFIQRFYQVYVCVTECDQVQQEPLIPTMSRQTRLD